jgi:hypothetical protein
LSLFPSAGKVTKRAAAADKLLKINAHYKTKFDALAVSN